MYLLTVLISVTFIIPMINGQNLNCIQCEPTQPCFNNKTLLCDNPKLTCYVAQLSVGGEIRYKKGCIESDFCTNVQDLCPSPGRDPQSGPKAECVGGGCCDTTGCVANVTSIPKPSPTVASSSSVPAEKAMTSKIMSTPKMEAATSTQAPLMKSSIKAMMSSPVSPSTSKMSGFQVHSQILTKQVLGSPTPTPTCSSIRYLSSPLAILIVAITIVYVFVY